MAVAVMLTACSGYVSPDDARRQLGVSEDSLGKIEAESEGWHAFRCIATYPDELCRPTAEKHCAKRGQMLNRWRTEEEQLSGGVAKVARWYLFRPTGARIWTGFECIMPDE
ncbi:MAG: hypothetical protein AAF479_15795 [Pseudomonadota bacterium]